MTPHPTHPARLPARAAHPAPRARHAYVGREAISGRRFNVVGDELLYRSRSCASCAPAASGSRSTSQALAGGASRPARIVDTVRRQNRELCSLAGTRFSAPSVFLAWYESVRWTDDTLRRL